MVTRALRSGTPLTVLPRFDPVAVTAAAKTGATLTSLVSTALRRIDSTIFRTIVLGGARAPVDRPPNTVTTYGLTETGSGVVYDGRPLHGVEIRIAGDGEVLVRCPMQLRAYRNAPSPVDADGWLHTGDLGELRADGTLSVQGRRGDLIISGGENIWPDVVEAAIGAHPGVADVGVAGLPDAEWGHLVAAWIVPTTNSQLPNLEDIRSFVADTLPSYMAPRVMFLVDDLQRTSLGKLRRTSLVPPDSTR